MKSRLPTLIFADENHLDPLLSEILLKLTPKLKEIGYTAFYSEQPANLSSDQLIQQLDQGLSQIEEQVTIIENINKDIIVPILNDVNIEWDIQLEAALSAFAEQSEGTDAFRHAIMLLGFILAAKQCVETNCSDGKTSILQPAVITKEIYTSMVSEYIKQMRAMLSVNVNRKCLLNELKAQHIIYRGIDDSDIVTKFVSTLEQELQLQSIEDLERFAKIAESNAVPDSNQLIFDTLKQRNNTLLDAYLNTTESVFGDTGLLHVEGIQKAIAEHKQPINHDEFDFIYIHSDSNIAQFLPDAGAVINNVLQGKANLPLGITLINATNKNSDEIVAEVLRHIQAKISAINTKNNAKDEKTLSSSDSYKAGSPRLFRAINSNVTNNVQDVKVDSAITPIKTL